MSLPDLIEKLSTRRRALVAMSVVTFAFLDRNELREPLPKIYKILKDCRELSDLLREVHSAMERYPDSVTRKMISKFNKASLDSKGITNLAEKTFNKLTGSMYIFY